MRRAVRIAATVALALWTIGALVTAADALLADCAQAASEISDPCAFGRGMYVATVIVMWLIGALALGVIRYSASPLPHPARDTARYTDWRP